MASQGAQGHLEKRLALGMADQEDARHYAMSFDLARFVSSYQAVSAKCRYRVFRFEDHDTVFPTAFSHGLIYL